MHWYSSIGAPKLGQNSSIVALQELYWTHKLRENSSIVAPQEVYWTDKLRDNRFIVAPQFYTDSSTEIETTILELDDYSLSVALLRICIRSDEFK